MSQRDESKRHFFWRQKRERQIDKLPKRRQLRALIEQQRRDARSQQSFTRSWHS